MVWPSRAQYTEWWRRRHGGKGERRGGRGVSKRASHRDFWEKCVLKAESKREV